MAQILGIDCLGSQFLGGGQDCAVIGMVRTLLSKSASAAGIAHLPAWHPANLPVKAPDHLQNLASSLLPALLGIG